MDKQDTGCGLGHLKPAFLQPCANIVCFTTMCSFGFLLTNTLSYYVDSQVTTLEKQFGFSSSQTGLLLGANDIGFLVFVLFASYSASKVHIPRSLGATVLLFGISGVICALPHFIFGARQDKHLRPVASNVTSQERGNKTSALYDSLCLMGNLSQVSCDTKRSQKSWSESVASEHVAIISFVIIFTGMFLQGLSKAPRQSLAVIYLERNTSKVNMVFVSGFVMTAALVGPAIAFSLGGVFSRIYVTLEETNLNRKHPRWVGAWWLGFLFFGCLAILTSLTLFWFPQKLPDRVTRHGSSEVPDASPSIDSVDLLNLKLVDTEQTHKNERTCAPLHDFSHTATRFTTRGLVIATHTKKFLKTLLRLSSNPVLLLTVFSSCFTIFATAGMKSYSGKYLEITFNLTVFKANIILSIQGLVSTTTGTFLGGYMTKRFKMTPKKSLRFLIFMQSLTLALTILSIFPACEQPTINNWPSFKETCNKGCNCKEKDYFPICGEDGKSYYSPCYAGCVQAEKGVYQNCSCIPEGRATAGICDYSCSQLYIYCIIFVLRAFTVTLCIMPKMLVYVRIVEPRDMSTALGFQAFMVSLLGWLLSPVVLGFVIDGVCTVWDVTCGVTGRCLLYDNDLLRYKLHGFSAVAIGMSLLCSAAAYLYGVRARVKNFDTLTADGDDKTNVEI